MAEQFERELLIEAFQPIVKELVVVVARRPGGNARCYPVAETVNMEGVCKEIRSPAAIGSRVATEAMETARKIADELDAQGVIAVEFFLTTAGLMVNEIAGPDWLDPDWFRFGASTLLNDLLMQRTKMTTGRYSGPDYFTLD